MRTAMLYRKANNTQGAAFYAGQTESLPRIGEPVLIHNAQTGWEAQGIVSSVDSRHRVYTVAVLVPRLEQAPLFAGVEAEAAT